MDYGLVSRLKVKAVNALNKHKSIVEPAMINVPASFIIKVTNRVAELEAKVAELETSNASLRN